MVNIIRHDQSWRYYNQFYSWGWEPLDEARLTVVEEALKKYAVNAAALVDVGCGSGKFTQLAASRGINATGVDISQKVVASLQKKGWKHTKFLMGRAESLPVKKHSFQVGFCLETLEHLVDPALGLDELARVILPGGLVMISVPNWFAFDRLVTWPVAGKFWGLLRKVTARMKGKPLSHLQFKSPRQWETLFKNHGFTPICSRPVYIFPYIPDIWIFKQLERRLWAKSSRRAKLRASLEEKLAYIWPFTELGQSHFWVLKRLIK